MIYRRLALAFALSLTPALASAASVVMVQFGSFETMAEAQKRLSDVKAAHGAALGNLPVSVREVKLPPDNLTVYRTQAGPVDSRSAAQGICSKLANTGDECYVVETAMSSATAPAVASSPAPIVPPEPANVPASTRMAAAEAAPRAPMLAPMDAPPAPSPEMQAALDRAAMNQAAPQSSISAPAPAPKPSFWSRMNPFSDSSHPAAPKPTNLKPDFEPAPEVMAATSSPMLAPVEAAPAQPMLAAGAINLNPPTTDSYESLPLLPPPPPLTARDEAFLRQNMALPPEPIAQPLPQTTTAVAPAPAAVASAPLPPANGSVQVEEAKRVPLSDANAPRPVVMQAPQPAPAVSLLPASTLGQKTLWAQVGQFNNPAAALSFWEQYRQSHPDFPVVRVRVSSSLTALKHGNDRVWLRVGPFARTGAINNLCASIEQSDSYPNLKCGVITDVGVAGNAQPATGYLNGSRYKR